MNILVEGFGLLVLIWVLIYVVWNLLLKFDRSKSSPAVISPNVKVGEDNKKGGDNHE